MSEGDPRREVDETIVRMRDQLLDNAVKLGARQGVSLSTVSGKVAGDGKFLPGLKGKGPAEINLSTGKYRKVMNKLFDLLGVSSDTKE